MAKRIIRLTESDLHKIIKESVKRALNEARPSAKELLNRYHKGPWGDWRDEYDAYWDAHFDDPRRGDLEKAARDAVIRDFGGFTPEYFKALRRHEAYRDAYHPFLSPSGRQNREKMDREYDEKYGFNPGEDEEDDYARLSRFLPDGGEEGGQKKQRARRGSNLSRVKAAPTYRQQQPDNNDALNQGSGMSLDDIEAKMRELGFAK